MSEIYGDYWDELPDNKQFLVISFFPGSIPLQLRWRNNGLSADFVADYLMTFFPSQEDDPHSSSRYAELKGAVSYIANELLENVMKFHSPDSEEAINFGIHLIQDVVILFSTNIIDHDQLAKLKAVIAKLSSGDPADLYIRHLEELAESEDNGSSGLGLLTIMNDYLAKVGWKIEPKTAPSPLVQVTTMVQLAL